MLRKNEGERGHFSNKKLPSRAKLATFLSCLKETCADPSEIIAAECPDFKGNVFSINHQCKGHLPGRYELTPQLCAMINSLPRKNKRIFATNYDSVYNSFIHCRARVAEKFQNPALLQITFKSFRHWGEQRFRSYPTETHWS